MYIFSWKLLEKLAKTTYIFLSHTIMQKFILIIQGPLCAGKSTVVKSLLAEHENLFYASFDRIKWLISHYDAKKHNIIKANLAFALSKEALANNLSVIVECGKQLE